ncbi:Gfo/Idh/MocA family protein [Paenibacillus solisilvae]|uniref:Gfo/Idh/MocA family protein n=1 Tax=Paenibacillus solisilvae TaxID=2486751 RepID=A0ABW0W5W0_9BACL
MKLGVIGYGSRIRHMINEIIKLDPSCHVAGIIDPREDVQFSGGQPIPVFSSINEMVEAIHPDGLLIGTRCSLHTSYALEAIPTGIPLYLEKPVSTTMEDWDRLRLCNERYTPEVVVSHPLRLTSIVQLAKQIVDSGQIGTIEHVQAINNVPYGGVYYHSWYRDEAETGGLFLQKATHDFDYLNFVINQQPISISAMSSKQVFKGDKPAGLTCLACEENRTCAESTVGTPMQEDWRYCCFAKDTGNEDSGSALIRYENGMHASYSQNFFARRGAAARGARFLGYKGTVDFDFTTGLLRVHNHHTPRVDSYQFEGDDSHFGGDAKLAANFLSIMRGQSESVSTLTDGLLSAFMCLKAKQSAETETFQKLDIRNWQEV